MKHKPVDVLFAISDTGGGHRSAAVAVSAALDQVSAGRATWAIEDILRLTDFPLVRSAPEMYDNLSTRWLRLYDLTFQLTNNTQQVDMLSRLIFLRARRNMINLLAETQPRVVVVTHPLVHRFVVAARRTQRLPCRIITVVTDLVTLHASWTYPGVDLTLLPTDEAYQLMYRRGMPPSKMLRTGFPVHPKFAEANQDKQSARNELGIATDRFTILLTSGGVGSGRLHQLVMMLEERFPQHQLLVVTGKNRILYEGLTARKRNTATQVYGFVNNMETLMAASDIVITKAGPGTLMEALVMRRPVIVTEAVGKQEQGNIDFVLNYELGMFCPTNERIAGAVQDLEEPNRYAATVHRLADAVPRDGSTQIARLVMGQMSQVGTLPQVERRRPPLLMGRLGRSLRRRRAR